MTVADNAAAIEARRCVGAGYITPIVSKGQAESGNAQRRSLWLNACCVHKRRPKRAVSAVLVAE